MRLNPYEIESIRECAARHFGPGAVVRLFGSRTRDDLRGGDIDLHITTEREFGSYSDPERRFKQDLEDRIGEQHIDVLVNGPGGPVQPIEKIAVATGIVLPECFSLGPVSAPAHIRGLFQRREAHHPMDEQWTRQFILDAIRSGTNSKAHIREALSNLESVLPIDADGIARFDRARRLEAESLLLNFGNLVAVIQDHLIRSILIAADETVDGRSRLDHRNTAEKLGALPPGLAFQDVANARNQLAHQYPADPDKQATLFNQVATAARIAIEAFDGLAAYGERLLAKKDEA